jgi:hypothetical protein
MNDLPRRSDEEHVSVVRKGAQAVAEWRRNHFGNTALNLVGADFRGARLAHVDLSGADLTRAILSDADLDGADLTDACLVGADLVRAFLSGAVLRRARCAGANLADADLVDADLRSAWLMDANLANADLTKATLAGAHVDGANFAGAHALRTTFLTDMTVAHGLEEMRHHSFSTIGEGFLLRQTRRPWPIAFLRGCGLTDFEIEQVRAIATTPIEFYSCFLSYSSKDDTFAVRLHDALQARGIRCWLDKHEILPGDNVAKKVGEGIRLWDKVLLCCSRNSLSPATGWWVTDEIERALGKERQLQRERQEETLAVIPLNLDDFLFDAACSHEHQPTLAKRHAARFVGWESDDAVFDTQIERVARALRADDLVRPKPPTPKL